MRLAVLLLLLLLTMTQPVVARADAPADKAEAWQVEDTVLQASAAGISVPQEAGGLSLTKSGEISDPGDGLDNYAQFASTDGVIQATAYIYLPSYADAAISAYMTEKAILERFGPSTKRTAYGVTAAGGREGVAIRSVYTGADSGLVTAAAFVHAGRWMVKLRVTGPADRAGEVNTGMDSLLAGLRFDQTAVPHPAMAHAVGSCPASDQGGARVLDMKAATTEALSDAEAATPGGDFAFPRDGRDGLCVRGTVKVGAESYDMLQANGETMATPVIIPLNDAGRIMRFDKLSSGAGYRLSVHQVGRTDVYNVYDRIPSARQIAAIIDGSDRKGATLLLSTAHGADGRNTVSN